MFLDSFMKKMDLLGPLPVVLHVLGGDLPLSPNLVLILVSVPHKSNQVVNVRFRPVPAVFSINILRKILRRHHLVLDRPPDLLIHKVSRARPASNHRRNATSHGFQGSKAETLPARRKDEAIHLTKETLHQFIMRDWSKVNLYPLVLDRPNKIVVACLTNQLNIFLGRKGSHKSIHQNVGTLSVGQSSHRAECKRTTRHLFNLVELTSINAPMDKLNWNGDSRVPEAVDVLLAGHK